MTLSLAVSLSTLVACTSSKEDGYLSPPLDKNAAEEAKAAARRELDSATYASVGKPFGCDTDCRVEELGFAEAKQDGVTKSEECATRFSEKSIMSNATQDGCRAYAQSFQRLTERVGGIDGPKEANLN